MIALLQQTILFRTITVKRDPPNEVCRGSVVITLSAHLSVSPSVVISGVRLGVVGWCDGAGYTSRAEASY